MINIKKYQTLFLANWQITLHDAMIYRFNTLFYIIFETLFLFGNFLAVHIGFNIANGSVNGWTREEGFLVTSIFNFTHHIFLSFFASFVFEIGEKSGNGIMDFILLKPQPPLVTLWASTNWLVQDIPSTLMSGSVLIYLMSTATNPHISAWSSLLCFFFIILGVLVRLSLGILCVSPVFFSEKIHYADSYWNLVNLGLYPRSVFPRLLQYLFTFGFPIMIISSIPAEIFFNMRSSLFIILSLLGALAFTWASFKTFAWSLKHYKSVNAGV